MRAVLDYCTGATRREVPAGTLVLHEGSKTGHLFVLVEGRLEVVKGHSIVAVVSEPGAMFGEMSVLAGLPRTATLAVPDGGSAKVLMIERPALRLLRKLPKFGQMLDQVYRNNGLRRTVDDVLDLHHGTDGKALAARLTPISEFRIYRKQQLLARAGEPIGRVIIETGYLCRVGGIGRRNLLGDRVFQPDFLAPGLN